MLSRYSISFVLCGLATLAACGGGGGNTGPSPSPPGAPTITSSAPGDGSATITFSAPASSGSSPITSYIASCTAGSTTKTASGASSPIAVTGLTNGAAYSCSVTATSTAGTGPASNTVQVTPAAIQSATVDPTHIPIGDGKYSLATPQVGYIYVCSSSSGGGGATVKGPWFNSDGTTWNSVTKLSVQGSVTWASIFNVNLATTLAISGNGLPPYGTGIFPISSSDPAYAYDRNPNSIAASTIAWGLPANPVFPATPSCVNLGHIGLLPRGLRPLHALDPPYPHPGRVGTEDACQGHPEQSGQYHHHTSSVCLTQRDVAGQHSPLVGYIADGFGIYGNLGENGRALANVDLDVCHGHTHAITVNGVSVNQYHYHMTREYPYSVGCYRGTPVTIH